MILRCHPGGESGRPEIMSLAASNRQPTETAMNARMSIDS